uniref:Integral membrane protein n=1 Tax=Heterorhabditis bacteriophora TaxID=37862 RepID=A0A1I7W7W9_HETBA
MSLYGVADAFVYFAPRFASDTLEVVDGVKLTVINMNPMHKNRPTTLHRIRIYTNAASLTDFTDAYPAIRRCLQNRLFPIIIQLARSSTTLPCTIFLVNMQETRNSPRGALDNIGNLLHCTRDANIEDPEPTVLDNLLNISSLRCRSNHSCSCINIWKGISSTSLKTLLHRKFSATSCLGVDSCYPLAFGVPAVLMIIATNSRRKVRSSRQQFPIILCTFLSLNTYYLLYIYNGFSKKVFVKDVKTLVRVCVMMLPVPMFWSLYDQQGSRWIIQAVAMDAQITSSFSILPDQMGTLNAIMIMAFIPIFQIIVYPLVEKCGIRTTSLRRMAVGGLLAAVSFSICGVVQLSVNKTLPDVPTGKQAFVSVINSFPNCNFVIDVENFHLKSLRANSLLLKTTPLFMDLMLLASVVCQNTGIGYLHLLHELGLVHNSNLSCPQNFTITTSLKGGKAYYIDLTPHGWMSSTNGWEKPQEGEGQFAMSLNLLIPCESINPRVTWKNCSKGETYNGIVALCKQDKNTDPIHPCNPKNDKYYAWNTVNRHDADVMEYSQSNKVFTGSVLDSIDVKPGSYQAYYVKYLAHRTNKRPTAQQTEAVPIEGIAFTIAKMGGVYTLTATTDQVGQVNH